MVCYSEERKCLFVCPLIQLKQKAPESITPDFQDVEYPEYDDFRAEANLQRRRQLESFAKAAEASQQGRKQVASFYAQQASGLKSLRLQAT